MSDLQSVLGDSTVSLALTFATALTVTYLLYRRRDGHGDGRKRAPSLASLPIVGSLLFMPTKMEDLANFCISSKNKLGRIFSLYAGSKYMLIVSGKQAIREALVTKSVDFADRPTFYFETLTNPRAKGIAFHRYNAAFKSHHQLCLSILKRFGFGQRVMETRIMMEVEEMVRCIRALNGEPFDTKTLTTSCVANVIVYMLYGRRFDHADATFQQLIADMSGIESRLSAAIEIFPPLRRFPPFKQNIAEASRINERVEAFLNSNIAACHESEVESFVNYYTEAAAADLDYEQLLMTTRDLVGAGMETTATTLRWAVVLLINHPAVQQRAHDEIDSVIGRRRLPALDDRSRLPYVDATIHEIMRYKTLVPFSIMHSTLNDTEVGGYFVPAGTMVMVNLHSAHMDPDDWQQPELFRPERFLDNEGNVINRERIIPFSLGKRSCLGEQLARQEIFLFLVTLLQNFDFKPPPGQQSVDVHEVWTATIQPSVHTVRLVARDE